MNNNVIKCSHCGKIFFKIGNDNKCPFCKEDLKGDDSINRFKKMFGDDNLFNDLMGV